MLILLQVADEFRVRELVESAFVQVTCPAKSAPVPGRHSLAAQCLCSVVQRARMSETIWSEALPSPLPSSPPPLPLPVFVLQCKRLKDSILYMNINAALLPALERPTRTPAAVAPVEFTACKSAGVGQRVIAARVCGGCGSRSAPETNRLAPEPALPIVLRQAPSLGRRTCTRPLLSSATTTLPSWSKAINLG